MLQMGVCQRNRIFAISSFVVDVDSHPVFIQSVRWISIADQQTGIVRKSICSKDPIETSHASPARSMSSPFMPQSLWLVELPFYNVTRQIFQSVSDRRASISKISSDHRQRLYPFLNGWRRIVMRSLSTCTISVLRDTIVIYFYGSHADRPLIRMIIGMQQIG